MKPNDDSVSIVIVLSSSGGAARHGFSGLAAPPNPGVLLQVDPNLGSAEELSVRVSKSAQGCRRCILSSAL